MTSFIIGYDKNEFSIEIFSCRPSYLKIQLSIEQIANLIETIRKSINFEANGILYENYTFHVTNPGSNPDAVDYLYQFNLDDYHGVYNFPVSKKMSSIFLKDLDSLYKNTLIHLVMEK